eukprot:CAMPEP_0176354136 /NCGR_PEP_ID=MMETSP0126-20121128/12326_1 /TAXON_ID=141414 ORGANISM="Strombidinopsis acuminatum, Strain SPMC142" /NCGR_SAMPLE_ID=MMETSP0126 /ASSEMBLY_ACC=CAM_ASM_000229 /LENGTH=117 /DNA_ID=CAMNT_0017706151 /DNA_START=9127 /DNA_END=9480 /DNA_ORIENTATION=+
MAATVPEKPTSVTTTVNGALTDVFIDWTAPTENGGTEITSYAIFIKKKDGTFATDASCDGTTLSVRTNTICQVSITILKDASSYNLATGDTVEAKVVAYNAIGDSDESTVGGTAVLP